ncbi:hypothetical protein Tco_0647201, partial [Tanacetum coccineum]
LEDEGATSEGAKLNQ